MGVAACSGGPPPKRASSEHAALEIRFSTAAAAVVHVGASTDIPIRVSDSRATISESGPTPSGTSFRVGQGGTAAIVGVPGGDTGGYYRVRLTAVDGSQHVSQQLTLSVDEMPYFPTIDSATFGASEYHSNQDVIVATGYPMPKITYTGTLPDGFKLTLTHTGMVTISGSPGTFESPCSSQITMHAVSAAGTATLPVTIKIGDWRCPLNVAGSLISHIGGAIVSKAGKVVGNWLWQNGAKAAAWVWQRGRAVVVSPEAEQGVEGAAGDE
jgi:hypothetical protein